MTWLNGKLKKSGTLDSGREAAAGIWGNAP